MVLIYLHRFWACIFRCKTGKTKIGPRRQRIFFNLMISYQTFHILFCHNVLPSPQSNNMCYYVVKFYSCSWLVKTQGIIYCISKMTRYFSCCYDQRAIILYFGPNFSPGQSIIARCRTQAPSTVHSLLIFPPKLNNVWE